MNAGDWHGTKSAPPPERVIVLTRSSGGEFAELYRVGSRWFDHTAVGARVNPVRWRPVHNPLNLGDPSRTR